MTTIFVGTDLSDNALTATRWALGLARLYDEATLRVVYVLPNDEFELRQTIAGHDATQELEETKEQMHQWLGDVDTDGVNVDVEVHVGRRAKTLSALTDEANADWLVVGKSGRGRLSRFFLGSTAEDLAMRPPCPLVLVHPDTDPWAEPLRVVSAVDLGDSSGRAAALGADLARRHGGDLTLLHVISLPEGAPPIVSGPDMMPETLTAYLDESTTWAKDQLNALVDARDLPVDDVSTTVDIRPGYPIHETVDALDSTGANLLTLGSQGRSRLTDFMLGGVGRSLVKRAPCTILLTPPGDQS